MLLFHHFISWIWTLLDFIHNLFSKPRNTLIKYWSCTLMVEINFLWSQSEYLINSLKNWPCTLKVIITKYVSTTVSEQNMCFGEQFICSWFFLLQLLSHMEWVHQCVCTSLSWNLFQAKEQLDLFKSILMIRLLWECHIIMCAADEEFHRNETRRPWQFLYFHSPVFVPTSMIEVVKSRMADWFLKLHIEFTCYWKELIKEDLSLYLVSTKKTLNILPVCTHSMAGQSEKAGCSLCMQHCWP